MNPSAELSTLLLSKLPLGHVTQEGALIVAAVAEYWPALVPSQLLTWNVVMPIWAEMSGARERTLRRAEWIVGNCILGGWGL